MRTHHVEYRRPALPGERVRVRTWVANYRRAFSLRWYRFTRAANGFDGDDVLLASGETDWTFVDAATGRPRSIPEAIKVMFDVPPEGWEP